MPADTGAPAGMRFVAPRRSLARRCPSLMRKVFAHGEQMTTPEPAGGNPSMGSAALRARLNPSYPAICGPRTCARSASIEVKAAPASPRARRSSRCRPRSALRQRADAVDRADASSPSATAPSARTSAAMPALASTSVCPARHEPALDQRRERHARRLARGQERRRASALRQRLDRGDARFGAARA